MNHCQDLCAVAQPIDHAVITDEDLTHVVAIPFRDARAGLWK